MRKIYPYDAIRSPCEGCQYQHYDKVWPYVRKGRGGKLIYYAMDINYTRDAIRYSAKFHNPCPCKKAENYDRILTMRYPFAYGPGMLLEPNINPKRVPGSV